MLGVYSHWGFDTTVKSPFDGSEIEFYDYDTLDGRLELTSEPQAHAALAMLTQLQLTVIPEELRAPLPAAPETVRQQTDRSLRFYLSPAELSRSPDYRSWKTCKASDWGPDF